MDFTPYSNEDYKKVFFFLNIKDKKLLCKYIQNNTII